MINSKSCFFFAGHNFCAPRRAFDFLCCMGFCFALLDVFLVCLVGRSFCLFGHYSTLVCLDGRSIIRFASLPALPFWVDEFVLCLDLKFVNCLTGLIQCKLIIGLIVKRYYLRIWKNLIAQVFKYIGYLLVLQELYQMFVSAIAQQADVPQDISTGGSKSSSHRDTQISAKYTIKMLFTIARRNKKGKYQLEHLFSCFLFS